MGFEDAIKNPLSWMRREPSILLLTVITWLPGLLLLPVVLAAIPSVQGLLAQSNNDVATLITQHGGELLQALLPVIIVGLLVLVLSAVVKVFVSLALANAAAQLRQQKPLSLSDALESAKNRVSTLVVASLVTIGLLIAAMFVLVLAVFLAVAALTIPVVGILIALLLGVLFLAALVVFGFASSAVSLLLPVMVSQSKSGGWNGVKNAYAFVNRFKLQSAGLVVIVVLVQMVFGQAAMAGMPHLWLIIAVALLAELVVFTWTNLFAAEFWFQYVGQPAAKDENKTPPSTPASALSAQIGTFSHLPRQQISFGKQSPASTHTVVEDPLNFAQLASTSIAKSPTMKTVAMLSRASTNCAIYLTVRFGRSKFKCVMKLCARLRDRCDALTARKRPTA